MSDTLQSLRTLLALLPAAEERPASLPSGDISVDLSAFTENYAFLLKPAVHEAIAIEPYWPKWDGPWWRMTLLAEMDRALRIPNKAIRGAADSVHKNCLHSFPFRIEDVPPEFDPIRGTVCHCQLGTLYQVLWRAGVDVDAALPWARGWFLKYQLPDGGLNCDEAAYTRPQPRSSMVSSLPPLEAVLRCTKRAFTPEEEAFLDRGAEYLLRRRLCRSLSRGGAVIDPAWCMPCFPRFYHYDVLRGLSYVVEWAEARGKGLPAGSVVEAVRLLSEQLDGAGWIIAGRRCWEGAKSLRQEADGSWKKGQPARSFPLLESVGAVGEACEWLTRQWSRAVEGLKRLDASGRLE